MGGGITDVEATHTALSTPSGFGLKQQTRRTQLPTVMSTFLKDDFSQAQDDLRERHDQNLYDRCILHFGRVAALLHNVTRQWIQALRSSWHHAKRSTRAPDDGMDESESRRPRRKCGAASARSPSPESYVRSRKCSCAAGEHGRLAAGQGRQRAE